MSHAQNDLLIAYANGTLSDGFRLLVACHLTYCPKCRTQVRDIEALGGVALHDEAPGALAPDAMQVALSRLDAAEDGAESGDPVVPAQAEDVPLPAPLRACLAETGAGLDWRFRLPGLSECRLDGFGEEKVSLLRARPGTGIPAHTHTGEEATLILSGAMRDGETVLRRGDVALTDHSHDHRPEIVGPETCVCLIVMSGRLRFTGPFGRAMNIFTG